METTPATYIRIVPRELTGQIKGVGEADTGGRKGGGRGKWENILADTEADAANDSVRGNLRVLSVLATWGPPTSNHEPAHASTSFPADQPPLERASFSASNDFAPTTRPLLAL